MYEKTGFTYDIFIWNCQKGLDYYNHPILWEEFWKMFFSAFKLRCLNYRVSDCTTGINMEILQITWKLLNLILSPCRDINTINSRCNWAINVFYKHILHQHVEQHNQSRDPPVSRLERREEVIWAESCALWPKRYSEMNLWVTLALIFVYLTVHFKIDSDGCLSLDIYISGCFKSTLLWHHFCLSSASLALACFITCMFPHWSSFFLGNWRRPQLHHAIGTGKPFMHAL